MAGTFRNLSQKFNLATIVVNHMTTTLLNIFPGQIQQSSLIMIPALGESWRHFCTNRIILLWVDKKRCAWLVKSPSFQDRIVEFDINVLMFYFRNVEFVI